MEELRRSQALPKANTSALINNSLMADKKGGERGEAERNCLKKIRVESNVVRVAIVHQCIFVPVRVKFNLVYQSQNVTIE